MRNARIASVAVPLAISLFSAVAQAQGTARILSGFPPGGAVDALARVFAEKLSESIGRPVVVETKTGAAGQIAAEALKASPPDGNTLMIAPDSMFTVYPHTVKKPVYDTLNDFVAVAHTGAYPIGLAVGAGVPANDFREFVAWAKASPKNASYGTAGAGTTLHFLGLMMEQATGIHFAHVPYRGVGPAITDVIAGQVPAVILPLGTVLQQAKAGKARILAHSGSRRSPLAPDIPTFKELGYGTLEATGWFGAFAPAGMRAEILSRYNDIFVQATRTSVVRERMRALDLEIREMSPAELASNLKAEHERWGAIIRATGFSAQSQ